MQEPASVLFSLLNLGAHAHCLARLNALLRRLRRAAPPPPRGYHHPYPYAWLWQGYMALSINTWLWSAVFHSRDTPLTERLDYLSAGALIFFNLFLTLVRTRGLRSRAAQAAVAAPLAAFFARHAHHMLYVLFDYGYHVKVCLAAGAVQSLAWVAWAVGGGGEGAGRRRLLAFVAAVNACMALEVLDFPPLLGHTLDAHSLWHAATAPLVYLFASFITADVLGGGGEVLKPAAKKRL